MNTEIVILVAITCLCLGIVITLIVKGFIDARLKKNAQWEASRVTQRAASEATKIEKEAKTRVKDFETRARRNAEDDIRKEKNRISQTQENFKRKEKELAKERQRLQQGFEDKERRLRNREEIVEVANKKFEVSRKRLEEKIQEATEQLSQISSMNKEEAKKHLITSMRDEAKKEFAQEFANIEEEARGKAERKAKKIIGTAIARYAGEYSAEKTVTVIPFTTDDLKGKVIGKEGRNIRAFESLCGVDLLLDEVPDSVVISGFDPVRREVAKKTLETLFVDGRIHPSSIESTLSRVKKEMFRSIREDGEKACDELGITGVHPKILDLIGSLKYRTSYTQNNYTHAIEVGWICGLLAAQMNVNIMEARRAGLLHDIGKALDHSIEGSHAVIGATFAKKHGEKEEVCHAIRSHHEDEKPNTILAHLVTAADAISGARPGARKATQEAYIKRLEDLESIANSFDGVTRTFALQAGREIRVLVDGGKITDEQAIMMSRDIAKKIEKEMNYPGQIKVAVVREVRAVEIAR